jgi:hypothetical protein
MAPAHAAALGFFPLDEELGLLSGSLTPHQHESLARLCVHMPFARACQMLREITGVQVSEATARRQTYVSGEAYEAVQTAHAQPPKLTKARACRCQHCGKVSAPGPKVPSLPVAKLAISSDGAYVPLVGGEWAEVKTLAIGQVKLVETETGVKVQTSNISYFSRLTDAQTFGDLALAETQRRGVERATHVCAVQDGADWLQAFVDLHRPDAVRILDFPHAAEYVNAIGQAAREAGTELPATWLQDQLHRLKHQGPTALLADLRALRSKHPQVEVITDKLAYLEKREAHMQYPTYQAQGWPIGSGMVESANKQVMQTRLKGPGMHWARPHVNPMLALRTAECNDRGPVAWLDLTAHRLHQRAQLRMQLQQQCAAERQSTAPTIEPGVPPTPSKAPPAPLASVPADQPSSPHHPASTHPWRRPFLKRSPHPSSSPPLLAKK